MIDRGPEPAHAEDATEELPALPAGKTPTIWVDDPDEAVDPAEARVSIWKQAAEFYRSRSFQAWAMGGAVRHAPPDVLEPTVPPSESPPETGPGLRLAAPRLRRAPKVVVRDARGEACADFWSIYR